MIKIKKIESDELIKKLSTKMEDEKKIDEFL